MNFLAKIGNGLRALIGLVLPMLRKADGLRPRRMSWGVHIVALLVVVGLLQVVHVVLDLRRLLPNAPSPLDRIWLPLLFLLFYVLCWLVWWFWKLLAAAPESSAFPDIDRAWAEAMGSLADREMDLSDAPLFLVLGRPDDSEEVLFAGCKLKLAGVPRRADAPIHVYAGQDAEGRDAIYVSCAGASLTGAQGRLLTGEMTLGEADGAEDAGEPEQGHGTVDLRTMTPEGEAGVQQVVDQLKQLRGIEAAARAEGRPLTRAEVKRIKLLNRQIRRGGGQARSLHSDVEQLEYHTARLRHVCMLIAEGRRPFCGLNGVLAVFTLAGTDTDEDAVETGACLLDDLETVRESFQVDVPVLTLVTGLEQVDGFDTFVGTIPPNDLKRRLGQRFPLVPELEPREMSGMVMDGVGWIGTTMFPNLALGSWKVEIPEQLELAEALRTNADLYRFLEEIESRLERVTRGLTRGGSYPKLLSGCYVAGTGTDSPREQAFLPGVLVRLTEEQDNVAWTDAALDEDARYARMTGTGYLALAVVAALGVAAIAYPFVMKS